MSIEFTGAERVLFKAEYDFALNIEKLTEAEATEKAMNKILSVRALSKKIKFKY
jgi:hypothetical protein